MVASLIGRKSRQAGVEGVYDRHSYREEKTDALRRLAALVDGIVNPRANS
jgi:hypothetical protein